MAAGLEVLDDVSSERFTPCGWLSQVIQPLLIPKVSDDAALSSPLVCHNATNGTPLCCCKMQKNVNRLEYQPISMMCYIKSEVCIRSRMGWLDGAVRCRTPTRDRSLFPGSTCFIFSLNPTLTQLSLCLNSIKTRCFHNCIFNCHDSAVG